MRKRMAIWGMLIIFLLSVPAYAGVPMTTASMSWRASRSRKS